MDTTHTTRRDVLRGAAALTAVGQTTARAQQQSATPDSIVNLGVIGLGDNGSGHLRALDSLRTKVRVVAVCDIYKPHLERGVRATGAKGYHDYNDLLADKNIEAVLISTPDHWHAQMAIDAMRAGKDVNVEKPIAVSIEDARRMVAVAKETGRILAVDAEHTAHGIWSPARLAVERGVLGKLVWSQTSRSRNTPAPPWAEKMSPDCTPQNLDWNRWLGSAPKVPFDPVRFYSWRRYWEYSNGIATDLYVHHLTPLMKVVGPELPVRVVGSGGNWVYSEKQMEVPDTFVMTADFRSKHTIVVGGSLVNSVMTPIVVRGHEATIFFYGPDQRRPSHLVIRAEPPFADAVRERIAKSGLEGKWIEVEAVFDADQQRRGQRESVFRIDSPPSESFLSNFLRCVRTREKPIVDGELAYQTHVTIMMAVESYRRNIVAFFDESTGRVLDKPPVKRG
jgi:predicted dehydrogenase